MVSFSRLLPAAFPDDIAEEILLRLPPDEPACLLRASLVCRGWRRLIAHPDFLRRLQALHRNKAPLLGFFHGLPYEEIPRFIPTTASAFSLPVPDCRSWEFLEFRHGRVLLVAPGYCGTWELLVWEPITGLRRRLQSPPAHRDESGYFSAAVVCAADGCDHRACHGGPFRVVFAFADLSESATSACVYSSETRAWGEPVSFPHTCSVARIPTVLVGSRLYFSCCCIHVVVEYDLAAHSLEMLLLAEELDDQDARVVLFPAEDGGLGYATVQGSHLGLWSRDVNADADEEWAQRRAIDLDQLLPDVALTASRLINAQYASELYNSTIAASHKGHVIAFSEEANAIFVSTIAGVFSIELETERATKVYEADDSDDFSRCSLVPFTSFYIPGKEAAVEEEPEEEPVSTLLHL